MGIYLHNMEMPKERESFTVTIKYNGLVFDTETMIQVAEAQEVPPHGRLIDADALNEAMARMVPWAITDPTVNAFLDGLSAAYEAIQAAPTVLEAEEGE